MNVKTRVTKDKFLFAFFEYLSARKQSNDYYEDLYGDLADETFFRSDYITLHRVFRDFILDISSLSILLYQTTLPVLCESCIFIQPRLFILDKLRHTLAYLITP